MDSETRAVAVYCGSTSGKQPEFTLAAESLGRALLKAGRSLVYGGGSKGLMGTISRTVLDGGGKITGVVPYAMVAAGGEGNKSDPSRAVILDQSNHQVETIIVDSMHQRKVEMARRSVGFVGLPGGFGTFEEVLEVTTWTQLGIHRKPVVILNVLSYYDPLRELIRNAISEGFISPRNAKLIIFVDGPESRTAQADFDWGTAALQALEDWSDQEYATLYDWSVTQTSVIEPLSAT